MPRKIFTPSDMHKLLASSRKNRKKNLWGLGEISPRLSRMVRLWANFKANKPVDDNDDLKVNDRGIITLSNNENIETEVFIKDEREYYEEASFRKTFDTEVGQLITPAPPEEPEPKEEVLPPPAPTDIRIQCTNYHWSMDGKRGRTEKDKPSWHHNRHPLGNNPGGGYLVIPDDHPLFFLNTCEPKEARNTFNYEWSVDGEVVSTGPSFHMFNASDGGKGASDWDRDNDRPWHSHWRDNDDVIISVRVWNESGELKAKAPMRCAYDVGHRDHRDPDDKPLPRWKWHGTRYFDDDVFFKGGWKSVTEPQLDPKYRNRIVRIVDIKFDKYNTGPRTSKDKYAAKPWSKRQSIAHLQKYPKYDKLYGTTGGGIWGVAHRAHKIHHDLHKKVMEKALKKRIVDKAGWTIYKELDPFSNKDAFKGMIHINGKWVDLKDFWSGIPVKDPYDITNFMKKDKKGNYSSKGESECTKHSKWLEVQIQPGAKSKVIRFKWGFGYDTKKAKKHYWLYYGNWYISVNEESPDIVNAKRTCKPLTIDYYGPAERELLKKDSEFTKSAGITSTGFGRTKGKKIRRGY